MRGVVERNEGAYDEIWRRYSRSVRATSKRIVGHGTESDDVVAEVFWALWMRPKAFDPTRGSLESFLRLKAKGRSIDLVRATTSRRRREERLVRESAVGAVDVSSGLLTTELSSRIRSAVDRLPVREREAIHLAFFTDMTYTDVACHLGTPEGTVKSRIRSGLKRLSVSKEVQAEREGRTGPAPKSRRTRTEPAHLVSDASTYRNIALAAASEG